jgi:hypothetical protein
VTARRIVLRLLGGHRSVRRLLLLLLLLLIVIGIFFSWVLRVRGVSRRLRVYIATGRVAVTCGPHSRTLRRSCIGQGRRSRRRGRKSVANFVRHRSLIENRRRQIGWWRWRWRMVGLFIVRGSNGLGSRGCLRTLRCRLLFAIVLRKFVTFRNGGLSSFSSR